MGISFGNSRKEKDFEMSLRKILLQVDEYNWETEHGYPHHFDAKSEGECFCISCIIALKKHNENGDFENFLEHCVANSKFKQLSDKYNDMLLYLIKRNDW